MGDLKEQMEKWKLSRYKQPMRETLEIMKEGYESGVLSFLKKNGFGHIRFSYGNLYVPKKDLDQIKKILKKETDKFVDGDVQIMPKSILGEEHDCTKVHPNKTHKEWLMSQSTVGDVKEELEEFDEGRMKDIYTMDQEGKSAKEIAKHLKLKVSTVKSILGEEVLNEFTNTQIASLKKDYEGLRGKTISGPSADKLRKIFDKVDKSKTALVNLLKADIPFLSMMASSRLISKYGANASQLARMRKEELEEKFESGFAVRYLDPKNGKRFVVPFKTKKDADDKAAQLKKDGAKNVTITTHDLNFKETYTIQITKKDGGKLVIGKFNTPAEGEKYIKWYKTGDMSKTKSVKVIKEDGDSESGFNIAGLETDRPQRLEEKKYSYGFTMSSESGDDGRDQEQEGGDYGTPKYINAPNQKAAEAKQEVIMMKQVERINKKMNSMRRTGSFKIKDDWIELEESADYLASKMNDKQLANIKNVWKNKKASDVTQSVKDMIKKMDIPTQLAIKQADIPHLSKLVEALKDMEDYKAKRKALQDIQNDPKIDSQMKTAVMVRKQKLDKELQDLKGRTPIAAEVEPDTKKFIENADSGDDDSNFAIGMSKAKEIKKDYGSPLKKSTIVKGHEIAKAIKKDEHIGAKATFERLWSGHKRGDK